MSNAFPRRDPSDLPDDALEQVLARCRQEESGCLIWEGPTDVYGYGITAFKIKGKWKNWFVHRVAFYFYYGGLPMEELECIDHVCRVRNCCEPTHMEWVTRLENNLRGERVTDHCKHGHPFDEANTYWTKGYSYRKPQRMCRECIRIRDLKHKPRKHPSPPGVSPTG